MAGVSGSKKRTRRRPNPTALLTDDILALQTLAGFLYLMPFNAAAAAAAGRSPAWRPSRYGFANVSGTGPPLIDASFSFLPDREREHLFLEDSCNGLLLCRCYRIADRYEFDYLVINPATEKWVAVPVARNKAWAVRLGFDPAVSPDFYIFEFQLDDDAEFGQVLGVNIYSSPTGVWIHKKSNWNELMLHFKSVFLNGVLYVNGTNYAVGALDVEGKTWRIIEVPRSKDSLIDQSQGRLHLARPDYLVENRLEIYVLEDKDSEEWTLKHTVSFEHLVGTVDVCLFQFIVVAFHPDRNMVFFVFGNEKTLMSYDMDSGELCTIRNLNLGRIPDEEFLPYVPLFTKTLPDGGN